MTTIALCSICHDRPDELQEMLASAQGELWDEVIVLDMASSPAIQTREGVKSLRSEANLGPAFGRNLIAQSASSDILVFLDDDTRLISEAYARVGRLFDQNPRLGLIAFRIQRSGGAVVSMEYPFRGSPPVGQDGARPCSYFVGAGYACRKSAVDQVGGYDEGLFIHGEELDLSFNLIRGGWELAFEPTVVIEHLPSVRGRAPGYSYWPLTMRNRAITARRYLPRPIAVIHIVLWGCLTLLRASRTGGLREWLPMAVRGLRQPVDRRPLGWASLLRLHKLRGRVFW